MIGTLFSVGLLLMALAGPVAAQVNDTTVTPDARNESELPTQPDTIGGDVPEREPVNEVTPESPEESVGESLVIGAGLIVGALAAAALALVGIAYVAFKRGGRR